MDGEVLPTMLENSNVTIMVDEVNNTEVVTVVSYAAEATIVTPAAYACNVSSPPSSYPVSIMQYTEFCCHKSQGAAFTCLAAEHFPHHVATNHHLQYVASCHACIALQLMFIFPFKT